MRKRGKCTGSFLLVGFVLAFHSAPIWAVQVSSINQPIPAWQAWRAFHESMQHYDKRSPDQVRKFLEEQFGLSTTQTSTLLNAGQSFVAELQRIDQDARAEAAKRYKYVPANTPPPAPGTPTRRPAAPQKSMRERAIADGLYAQIEARKQEAVAKHLQMLAPSIAAAKIQNIDQYIKDSIVPKIKTFMVDPKAVSNREPSPRAPIRQPVPLQQLRGDGMLQKRLLIGALTTVAICVVFVPDSAAYWGFTDIELTSSSGTLVGFHFTTEDWWDEDFWSCTWEEWNPYTGSYFCAEWEFYSLGVGTDAYLQRPSGGVTFMGFGFDPLAGSVPYEITPDEQGMWVGASDHWAFQDVFTQECVPHEILGESCFPLTFFATFWLFLTVTDDGAEVPPLLTWIAFDPTEVTVPGCSSVVFNANVPSADFEWYHHDDQTSGVATAWPNGDQTCVQDGEEFAYGTYSILRARNSAGGPWITMAAGEVTVTFQSPYLHESGQPQGNCGSVERGGSITVILENASGLSGNVWKFTANGNVGMIENQNQGQTTWSGVMVASGTIRVDYSGGFRECTVTVNDRNWSLPLPPLDHIEGSPPGHWDLTLATPPSVAMDLGRYRFDYDIGATPGIGISSQEIVPSGPNKDFAYFTAAPSGRNAYWINPDLDYTNPILETGKPNTTFAFKQCGNFSQFSNGFISWDDLVRETRRHEYNHPTASHRGRLGIRLADGATNPGVYLENKVWGPNSSMSLEDFGLQTATGLSNLIFVIIANYVANHSGWGAANETANGTPLGNVNFPPYQVQPFCP